MVEKSMRRTACVTLLVALLMTSPAAAMRPGRDDSWNGGAVVLVDPPPIPPPVPTAPAPAPAPAPTPAPQPAPVPVPPAPVPGPPAPVCQAGYNYAARSSLGTLLNPFGASITEQAEPTILGARDHTTAYVNLGYRNPDTRTIPYWVQGGIVRGSVGGVADVGHPMVYVEAQTPAGYTYRTLGEASVGSTHSFRLTATGTTGTLVAITIDGVSQGTYDLGTVANDASVAAESYTDSGGACPHYDWRWSQFAPSVPTTMLGRLPSTATDDSVSARL